MSKPIIKANLKGSDKIELKYNNREVEMTLEDFKTYLDEVLEPTSAVLTANEPLRYKALLSQNAPVASTNNDTMIAGQIWELSGAANPSDYATIDTFELVSGTLYAAGSKYRVSVDTPFTLSASAMEYDGSPYIVSTDSNGDFNPFVNTLGEDLTFEYDSAGIYLIKSTGIFKNGKTIVRPIQTTASGLASKSIIVKIIDNDTDISIYSTNDGSTFADDELYYTPIEIEVYP